MARSLRVLHIVPGLDPLSGGPSRSVPALCRALREAGADVALRAFAPGSARRAAEYPWLHLARPFPGSRQLPTPAYVMWIRRQATSYDLVHLHSLWNPAITLAAIACRSAGLPYVLSPRGMLQTGALRRRWRTKLVYYRIVEGRTIAGARAIHFFTEAEARDSSRLVPAHKPSIIIPNGIELPSAEQVAPGRFRARYPQLRSKRVVLFLGRLHWSKGLDLQARAIALLARQVPDVAWAIVGPDAGEGTRLASLIHELGLADRVVRTGLLDQEGCLQALADADVFVMTSRHEAHSMALNEALAAGVPVVITETLGFREVETYGAGRVVPWEASSVASALAGVLTSPQQAAAMAAAGRRLASERFAWPIVAETMLRAYREVLSGGTTAAGSLGDRGPESPDTAGDTGPARRATGGLVDGPATVATRPCAA